MRIIRAAKRVQEAVVTCPKCKSVLGIEEKDIKYQNMKYQVFCPVCETWIGDYNKNALFPWIMEEQEDDRQLQGDNSVWVNTL